MSLYAEYMKEVYDKNVIENKISLIVWSKDDDIFYIEDIFIKEGYRSQGVGREMVDYLVTLAKEHGCTKLLGSISLLSKYKDENMRKFLKYGFKITSLGHNIIFLTKDI